jgi:hypothetical protein
MYFGCLRFPAYCTICKGLYSYGTSGIVVHVAWVRPEPNIEGDVLGEKCLIEVIEPGSTYNERK